MIAHQRMEKDQRISTSVSIEEGRPDFPKTFRFVLPGTSRSPG